MTRIGTPGAALLTLALLTSACGGGGSSAKDTAPTKAEATAAASAINLVQADVGADFKGSPSSRNDNTDKDVIKGVATCLNTDPKFLDSSHDVVDVKSDDFAKGQAPQGIQVSSSVTVLDTKDIANKQLAIFTNDKTAGCLESAFQAEFKKSLGSAPGATLGKVTIRKTDVDASGTDGAFAFVITLPITGGGLSLNVTAGIYGFLKGHTQVTLETSSFGSDFPDSLRKDLYGKLVERAGKSAV